MVYIRKALLLGLTPFILFGCDVSSKDIDGDGEYTLMDKVYKDYGDGMVSDSESVYNKNFLKEYAEEVEDVQVLVSAIEDIEELPNEYVDEEGNVYKKLYKAKLEYQISEDLEKHWSKALISYDNHTGGIVVLAYDSDIGNYSYNADKLGGVEGEERVSVVKRVAKKKFEQRVRSESSPEVPSRMAMLSIG